ncbi:MAG TPA: hypothetical protein PKC43_12350 [Phycisphaerales bacterium]|nr:hypothetical protein [Phycisphaerales bacterium]HMP38224.1 hypothetical protein [Phycisphaerales bacterium]
MLGVALRTIVGSSACAWIIPRVVAIALLGAAVAWLFVGGNAVARLGDAPGAAVERAERELRRRDPVAAQRLAELARERDLRVVAAGVDAIRSEGSATALSRLAESLRHGDGVPPEIALAQLAVDARLVGDHDRLRRMLEAQGAAIELLRRGDGGLATVASYIDVLEIASRDGGAWPVVVDDPLALAVWSAVGDDPALWGFYAENRELLSELVVGLVDLDGSAPPAELRTLLAADLAIARAHWTIVEPVLRNERLGAPAFAVLRRFGEVVRVAVDRHGLPLDETIEVIFANADQFEAAAVGGAEGAARGAVERGAGRLAEVRRDRPQLWELARRYPLALRLDRLAPAHAAAVLERFGDLDVAPMLVAEFDEREIPKLLAALDRFGDLAVWAIEAYSDDPRFRAALRREDVGAAIVPYLAMHGDAGLDRVAESPAWIAKYFLPDGTPRQESAWHAVPLVGAPIAVVRNWLDGVPNAWSEYGWALWDVADSVVLVASFGAGSAATQGVRQGLRAGARGAGRGAARAEAGAALRVGAAGAERSTFLVRAGRSAVSVAPIRWSLRAFGSVVAGGDAITAGLRQGWRGMPPAARRWALRVVGGAMLFVTLNERTIPRLPEVAAAVGAAGGLAARQALESVGTAIAAALEAAFAGSGPLGALGRSAIWWAVLAILLSWPAYLLVRRMRDRALARPA